MSAERWEDYFQPGEQLLWEGAPEPGFHDWPQSLFMTIFGIPFLAAGTGLTFGGLWAVTQAESGSQAGLALLASVFGLPFFGVGVFLVLGQWLLARSAPQRIRYALSSRAAYVAKRLWRRELSIYPIVADTPLELKSGRRADSIWFYSHRQDDSDGPVMTRAGFENIADGRRVLQLMRALKVQK